MHDNAANMLLGLDFLEVNHVSCFLHTLQLVIDDALFSQPMVKDLIAKCTHHSSLACEKLKAIQSEAALPNLKLIQDVPTRWNSTLLML